PFTTFINPRYSAADDYSTWQYQPPYNLTLVATIVYEMPGFSWQSQDDPSTWQWIPGRTNIRLLLPPPVSVPSFNKLSDDPSSWQYKVPLNYALLNPPAQALPLTTFVNTRYSVPDEQGNWQYRPPYNLSLAATITYPVEKWGVWSSPDDAAFWQ